MCVGVSECVRVCVRERVCVYWYVPHSTVFICAEIMVIMRRKLILIETEQNNI